MSSYRYLDLTGLSEVWSKVKGIVPTKTSDLTNDSGFITKGTYYVTISGNATSGYTIDKTFQEVTDAYDDGYAVFAINGTSRYYLSVISTSGMVFCKNSSTALQSFTWTKSSGAITYSTKTVPNDTNTTYSISISGNVITLTGSDSSTSTVTLPVYNGGVS